MDPKDLPETTACSDAAMLDWIAATAGKVRFMGNQGHGYVVWDVRDGLTTAGEGKTFREAIDNAMTHWKE